MVLVLPYISMNLPRVYTCPHPEPPSHLPPHTISLGHPSAPAPSILYPASNLDWRFVSYMILYVSMPDDMILYIENPKDSTRKLLELINEYSEVAEYKINTQKSLAFLYTNNEKIEREIRMHLVLNCNHARVVFLACEKMIKGQAVLLMWLDRVSGARE